MGKLHTYIAIKSPERQNLGIYNNEAQNELAKEQDQLDPVECLIDQKFVLHFNLINTKS